jgi:hypothetical protein
MSTVATIHLLHWPDVQDIKIPRGLDRALFLKLAACDRIAERRNSAPGPDERPRQELGSPARSATRRAEKTCSFSTPAPPKLFADLAIAHGDVC